MVIAMAITPLPARPDSVEQKELLDKVRPPDEKHPQPKPVYDLAVVGAGPAGLAAVDSATALGLSVALIERNRLGGNSLNAGSIPSKAIIGTARVFAAMCGAEEFGALSPAEPRADFGAVMNRMKRIRARIAEYHSAHRLRAAGVDIFFGDARFMRSNVLAVDKTRLTFKKALIATGARSYPCDIPGLEAIGYQTSETIFDLTALPRRLAVIGGGPLGCELAQAFCRLGSHVNLIQNNPKFLPDEERDAAELLSWALSRDGVETRLNTTVTGARMENGVKWLDTVSNEIKCYLEADEILLSIGRIPNVESLCLEKASIAFAPGRGITVDDFLRTTNPLVYAAGDVCMDRKFTNAAEASARMAVRNAFTGRRKRRSHLMIPWCTFCDPEIAHIGMHVREAREKGIPVKTFTVMMGDVDRAIVDGQDDGFVKIHVKEGTDTILGATIVASRASEMINEMSVVMSAGMGMRALANVLHTYPAQSEAIRLAALACARDQAGRDVIFPPINGGQEQ